MIEILNEDQKLKHCTNPIANAFFNQVSVNIFLFFQEGHHTKRNDFISVWDIYEINKVDFPCRLPKYVTDWAVVNKKAKLSMTDIDKLFFVFT